MTRRILLDQSRNYRPYDVSLVEALAAYQNPEDYRQLDPDASRDGARAERVTALIAHRIAVPDDPDPGEALKREIDLAHDVTFRCHRSAFFDWQRGLLGQNHHPADIADAIPGLVEAWNRQAVAAARGHRWSTAVLCVSLATGVVGLAAGLAPAAFQAPAWVLFPVRPSRRSAVSPWAA
jgi:hypothetical protein